MKGTIVNEKQNAQLRELEIGDLTDSIKRYQRIATQPGLSAEGQRLLRASAARCLDEATALRYGRRFQPTGGHGQREHSTV